MIITQEKPMVDRQKRKRKESKRTTAENCQITKRTGEERTKEMQTARKQ